jgi:hypothetical protein
MEGGVALYFPVLEMDNVEVRSRRDLSLPEAGTRFSISAKSFLSR